MGYYLFGTHFSYIRMDNSHLCVICLISITTAFYVLNSQQRAEASCMQTCANAARTCKAIYMRQLTIRRDTITVIHSNVDYMVHIL